MQMYVDDPVFIASGTLAQAAHGFTVALLWFSILGLPLAWKKSDGGNSITWIGAQLSHSPGNFVVNIPQDKIQDLLAKIDNVLQTPVVSIRTLRTITGKLSFVAGLAPQLRPFSLPTLGSKCRRIHS